MSQAATSRVWRWMALAVAVTAVVIVVLATLYVRGGGPIPEAVSFLRPVETDRLAASAPAEQVLRTLRLVGVDRAFVGERRGTAVLRIELPAADSSADVTAAWEAGLGALRVAYPKARTYVVQVFGPDATPLVELSWEGDAARTSDDGAQLRSRAAVKLLAEEER